MTSPINFFNRDDSLIEKPNRRDRPRQDLPDNKKDFKKYLQRDGNKEEVESQSRSAEKSPKKSVAEKKESKPIHEEDSLDAGLEEDSPISDREQIEERFSNFYRKKSDSESDSDQSDFLSGGSEELPIIEATIESVDVEKEETPTLFGNPLPGILTRHHEEPLQSKKPSLSLFDLSANTPANSRVSGKKVGRQTDQALTSAKQPTNLPDPVQQQEEMPAEEIVQSNQMPNDSTRIKKLVADTPIPSHPQRRTIENRAVTPESRVVASESGEIESDRRLRRKGAQPKHEGREGDIDSARQFAAQSSFVVDKKDPVALSDTSIQQPLPSSDAADIQELIDQINDKLYTVTVNGETDTSFTINSPNSLFHGAHIILSTSDSAPGQFNVTIEQLSQLAKNLVDMHAHQESLRAAFETKGLTLHNIFATTGTLKEDFPRVQQTQDSFQDQSSDERGESRNRQGRQGGKQQQ